MHFLQFIRLKYGSHLVKLFKKIIDFSRKNIVAKSSRKFLLRCRDYDIFPLCIDSLDSISSHFNLHSTTGNKMLLREIQDFKIKTLNILIEDICIHINFL